MKQRAYKVKKIRCSRQPWVDSGYWAYFNRRFELSMLKVRAERKAHMDAWRAAQEVATK